MSHYKPYPAYKDSGVKWLGRVPEHWYVVRMRYAATLNPPVRRDLLDDPDQEVSFLPMEAIGEDGSLNLEQNRPVADVRSGYSYFEDGDVAFAKVTPCFENGKGALMRGLQCAAGFGTTELTVLRPNPAVADARYINYIVQGSSFRAFGAGAMTGAGGLKRVPDEFTRNFPVSLPELGEQRVIASNLDRETACIGALIEKKTRFIELLREKRQALITHAVTKGLDPSVKMKNSGVEWLGEVPEHWRVMAIKHIVATPITDGPHETPEFIDEGVPFVSAEAVSSGRVDFAKIRGFISRNDHERYSQKYCPKRGDIFMIKSGATTGVTAIVETDDEFNIWSPLAVIRCGESADPYFVLNFMRSRSFQEAVALSWSYGTQQNIGMGVIGNLAVTVPPLDEQKRIALSVHAQCVRLDDLIDKTECSIALLKERRSALITAAVTGQIDLREAV
ncbi:restriction endonuclease subunit S [Pseudomonas aeruginosa]|uniref:restriction endonuclease subunit S n=1 Tax=Pseudomonas aeruginosa TaxID=287 RepID=UPI0028FF4647|nr:restriction endonuclease subunit S [Pseudomonas aeruginosa]MDU0622496.1 restriction endonuclease subunit S [Pseudomonas aeruginosa]